MPISSQVRAEGVAWTLPLEDLPSDLPQGLSRRGLFQVQRSYDYLKVLVGEEYIAMCIHMCLCITALMFSYDVMWLDVLYTLLHAAASLDVFYLLSHACTFISIRSIPVHMLIQVSDRRKTCCNISSKSGG